MTNLYHSPKRSFFIKSAAIIAFAMLLDGCFIDIPFVPGI